LGSALVPGPEAPELAPSRLIAPLDPDAPLLLGSGNVRAPEPLPSRAQPGSFMLIDCEQSIAPLRPDTDPPVFGIADGELSLRVGEPELDPELACAQATPDTDSIAAAAAIIIKGLWWAFIVISSVLLRHGAEPTLDASTRG
jgi:hypothetical protein